MPELPIEGHAWDAPRSKAAHLSSGVDARAIHAAILTLLHAIGERPDRPGLLETPARVARMWAELSRGYREDPRIHLRKTFSVESSDPGIVIQRGIPFYSLCEHHLVPFFGYAALAYIPSSDRVVGLSKLARLVHGYAARLQVQERLTTDIADALHSELKPKGTAVILHAEHLCIGMRGVRTPGSITTTSALHGVFMHDSKAREEVMLLLRRNGE